MNKGFSKRIKVFFFVSTIVLITSLGMIVFYFLNSESNVEPTNRETSQKNLDLIKDAKDKRNPTICNQIRGGIEEQEGYPEKTRTPDGLVIVKDNPGHSAMTEGEAKEQCYQEVSAILNR